MVIFKNQHEVTIHLHIVLEMWTIYFSRRTHSGPHLYSGIINNIVLRLISSTLKTEAAGSSETSSGTYLPYSVMS
jgi:hypothetical protein